MYNNILFTKIPNSTSLTSAHIAWDLHKNDIKAKLIGCIFSIPSAFSHTHMHTHSHTKNP